MPQEQLKFATARRLRQLVKKWRFPGSHAYWEQRYYAGGTSGRGSYGLNAETKARIVNEVLARYEIRRVVEFGCGDGNQLGYLSPAEYIGLDVSPTAIQRCITAFVADDTKSFFVYQPLLHHDTLGVFSADCALSQEVIFHLVEDEIFALHLRHLFAAANRLVLICSSDFDDYIGAHERHRKFTSWVAEHIHDWTLTEKIDNPLPYDQASGSGMLADFYVYEPVPARDRGGNSA